ncbi:CopG family transcriptional regulator [Kitasatospora sp. NPDC049258]|uniref:CopG family transcriptional regulator n=1 Tax=Kitasatospora sp. NPDC049258 TaxID=3155394 RepID=UPI003425E4CE
MSAPTRKCSITLPRDLAEASRARSGPSGLSAYVAAAVARRVERDGLHEPIDAAEAGHGPVGTREIQQKRAPLRRTREELHG